MFETRTLQIKAKQQFNSDCDRYQFESRKKMWLSKYCVLRYGCTYKRPTLSVSSGYNNMPFVTEQFEHVIRSKDDFFRWIDFCLQILIFNLMQLCVALDQNSISQKNTIFWTLNWVFSSDCWTFKNKSISVTLISVCLKKHSTEFQVSVYILCTQRTMRCSRTQRVLCGKINELQYLQII